MSTKSGKETEGNQDPSKKGVSQPKIMTKPLPEILDELEDYIKRVEEAVRQAQAAAKESREAAAEARESGEKAAEAARKAAEAAVAKGREEAATALAKVREEAAKALDTLGMRVSDLEEELNELKDKVKLEAFALDQAFVAAKDRHIESSPFLQG